MAEHVLRKRSFLQSNESLRVKLPVSRRKLSLARARQVLGQIARQRPVDLLLRGSRTRQQLGRLDQDCFDLVQLMIEARQCGDQGGHLPGIIGVVAIDLLPKRGTRAVRRARQPA